jgi:hypothetical protein
VDETQTYQSLSAYLQLHAHHPVIDHWIQLTHQRHPVRLIALRLPPDVAQARRQRVRTEGLRRRQQAPNRETLALCDWCVLATKVPASTLSSQQALLLYRSRWQIELLFKLWKQHGHLDQWRRRNLNRIQTKLYAKLLLLLVPHGLLGDTCWQVVDRSLVKAMRWLRHHLPPLLNTRFCPPLLAPLFDELARGMVRCRVGKRRKRPAFFQALETLFDAS